MESMLLQEDKSETPLAAAVQAAQGNNSADPVAQALTQEATCTQLISLFIESRLVILVDLCSSIT